MIKFICLAFGILLLSLSVLGQTIIPQKSDSLKKDKPLEYFGDTKDKNATKDNPAVLEEIKINEIPVELPDTVNNQPTSIKYYQMVELKEEPLPKKNSKNKNQIKTLSGNMGHSGGFGAVSFKTSQFKDKTLVLGGIKGGWIINRTLAIGLDMYGVIPTTKYTNISDDVNAEYQLLGGYGGMFLELILFSNEVVHISFPVSSGAGWLGFGSVSDSPKDLADGDVFWYIEPGANLELNISRNFRMDFGVSKRFTQDFVLTNTETDAFNEINYYLTLKIGRF